VTALTSCDLSQATVFLQRGRGMAGGRSPLNSILGYLLKFFGLEVAQKTCAGRLFKVGKSLHWGSPTLSALEVWVQSYRNPSRLETSLAAVDGRDVFGALSRPGHSTMPCIVAFLTVGSYWRSLPLSLPPMSLHAEMGSSPVHHWEYQWLPSLGLACLSK
jgi:hypothetical protein